MRLFLAAVWLTLSSCSRSETRTAVVDAASPPSPPPPPASLSQYCRDSPCRDYQAENARIRKLATPGQGPGCSRASIGRCGTTRYVELSDGFSGFEEYFDDAGAMIAARSRVDMDPVDRWYGSPQWCEHKPDVVLCRGGYLDAGP